MIRTCLVDLNLNFINSPLDKLSLVAICYSSFIYFIQCILRLDIFLNERPGVKLDLHSTQFCWRNSRRRSDLIPHKKLDSSVELETRRGFVVPEEKPPSLQKIHDDSLILDIRLLSSVLQDMRKRMKIRKRKRHFRHSFFDLTSFDLNLNDWKEGLSQ